MFVLLSPYILVLEYGSQLLYGKKISYIKGYYNLEIWDFSLIIPILTMVTVIDLCPSSILGVLEKALPSLNASCRWTE